MKIATWNVNGVRARQAQLQEFIDREQPDVLCLQEIKASVDQLPMWLCEIEGYSCYWHGAKGYSGVALHVRQATVPTEPDFEHPPFDYENRIVTVRLPQFTVASIYVPNGGKDFKAKMGFLEALDAFAASGFDVFAGSETFLLANMRNGGAGCISATANVNPAPIARLHREWQTPEADAQQARLDEIRGIMQRYPLIPALKAVIARYGGDPAWVTVRPPLVALTDEQRAALAAELGRAAFSMPGLGQEE